jgi:hypothetical protein
MTHSAARWTVILLALLLGGCNYQQGENRPRAGSSSDSDGYQWRSLYRTDVRTIAVPIFTNRDFRQGVEFQLSKAVINQIESQTPYKVVPRERADTILEGEISRIRVREISSDPNSALPQEQTYEVFVNFVWKDLRSGKILTSRRNFNQAAAYYPTLGEGTFVASQLSVEQLALGIVQELQADW